MATESLADVLAVMRVASPQLAGFADRIELAAAPAAPGAAVGVDEAWIAKMRKYYEVTQHGIGMARMALLANDMSKAKASLDRMSNEIDAALAGKAQEESDGK